MKWTEELIESELLKSIRILGVERMPTAEELKSIGRNDLHCKVSRTKKYRGWAEHLGLELKRSETVFGQEFERRVAEQLRSHDYDVELMSTKHPYDLLVDGCVKVDVKVAKPYPIRGSRVHSINLAKENPTCDIYICILLDDRGEVERELFIPSHHVQKKMLNIGADSKYNKYADMLSYLHNYSVFFHSVT